MASKQYLLRFGSGNPSAYSGLAPTFTKFLNSAGSATTAPSISELSTTGLYTFSYDPQGFIGFVCDGATTGLASTDRYIIGILDTNDKISEVGGTLTALGSSLSVLAIGATLTAQGATLVAIGNSAALLAVGATLTAHGATMVAIGNSLSVLAIGATLTAQGATLVAIGNSLSVLAIGATLTAQGATLVAIGNTSAAAAATLAAVGSSIGALAVGATMQAIGSTLTAQSATMSAIMGSAASSFGTDSADPTTLYGFMKRIQELQEGNSIYAKGTGVWTIYSRGSSQLLATKTITDSSSQVTKT